MAYHNNIYGNAAYSGFIRGAMGGRATPPVAPYLVPLLAAAQAFAEAVDESVFVAQGSAIDALVTTGASNTQLAITTNTIASNEQWKGGILTDICGACIDGRYDPDLVQADYATLADAIALSWITLVSGRVSP